MLGELLYGFHNQHVAYVATRIIANTVRLVVRCGVWYTAHAMKIAAMRCDTFVGECTLEVGEYHVEPGGNMYLLTEQGIIAGQLRSLLLMFLCCVVVLEPLVPGGKPSSVTRLVEKEKI